MSDAEKRAAESPKAGESREQLVDDLVSAEDYWLSVTDAARVTRRQEITIRRWIAVGNLPVRRQRMGLNKRTRHVRASDLAKLTPIIDPTATITGAPANADLLSIPVQQAQLLTTQHDLVQRLTPLEDAVAALVAQQGVEQERHQQEAFALRQEMNQRVQRAQDEALRHQRQVRNDLEALMQHLQGRLHEIAEQVRQEAEQRQGQQQEADTTLAVVQETLQQMEAAITTIQTQTGEERQALYQHLTEELSRQQQQWQKLARQLQTEWEHDLAGIQHDWQQRVGLLEAQHAELWGIFHAEQQHRQALQVQVRHLRQRRLRASARQLSPSQQE